MDKFIDRTNKYSGDFQRVSCWVYYEENKQLQVFYTKMPNTIQIYMQFFEMNHYFWQIIERDCLIEVEGYNDRDKISVYNNCLIKKFILKYLIKDWSFDCELKRNKDGSLTEESYNKVCGLHPKILKTLLDQYVYRQGFTQEEDGKIQKQCYLLFDKGQSINSPHWTVSLYLDLTAFWDKFGLNYYDIQKLPQEVFDGLRKIMGIQNSITASKYSKSNAKSSGGNGRQSKQIRF